MSIATEDDIALGCLCQRHYHTEVYMGFDLATIFQTDFCAVGMVKLLNLIFFAMLIYCEVAAEMARMTQLREDVRRLKAKLLELRLKIMSSKKT